MSQEMAETEVVAHFYSKLTAAYSELEEANFANANLKFELNNKSSEIDQLKENINELNITVSKKEPEIVQVVNTNEDIINSQNEEIQEHKLTISNLQNEVRGALLEA